MLRKMISLILVAVVLVTMLPQLCIEGDAATLADLTCGAFISNESNRNYIDMMMRYYISANSKLETALNNGKSVVFMFEGGSDNAAGHAYSASGSNTRDQAVTIVVQKINGSYEIVFSSESCSSIPSQPEDTNGVYAGGASQTTILDGIYRIQTCNHQGDYGALNVITSQGYYTPTSNKDGYVGSASGINIHTRSGKTAGGLGSGGGAWSAGCQLVGYGGTVSNKFNNFMKVVAGINKDVWINYGSKSFQKVTAYQDMGYYVVDRQLATSALTSIYTPTAISNITAYSRNAYTMASGMVSDLGSDFYAYLTHTASGHGINNVYGNVELGESNTTGSLWQFTKNADGTYYISSLVDGTYLGTTNGSTSNEANVCASSLTGESSQKWYIKQGENGYSLLNAGSFRALDVADCATELGSNIQLYTPNSTSAQILDISMPQSPGFAVSTNQIGFSINESKTVYITLYGSYGNAYLNYTSRDGIIDGSWGSWDDHTIALTLSAASTDDTDLRITMKYSDTDVVITEQVWDPVILRSAYSETKYTVYYDANGGSNAPEATVKTHGYSVSLRYDQPVRPGYNFLGWSADPNADQAQYAPGSRYTKNENTTLYAVWTPDMRHVTTVSAGTAYKLGMNVGDRILYFTGQTESASVYYRLATSSNVEDAVNVYLESVSGGYRLYFLQDGSKKYIRVYQRTAGNPGSGAGSLEFWDSAPQEVLTFDSAVHTLVYAYDQNNAYYMGSYLNKNTGAAHTSISVSNTSYITGSNASKVDVSQFPVRLYLSGESDYTVTFDANGGSGAPGNMAGGDGFVVPDVIPSRHGYNFVGWSFLQNATYARYVPGDVIDIYTDCILYAVWQPAATVFEMDTPTAEIQIPGAGIWYEFTPSMTTSYAFVDLGIDGADTKICLYDDAGNLIAMDDDSGVGYQFDLRCILDQGVTYRLYVSYFSKYRVGSIQLGIVPGYTVIYYANGGTGAPDPAYCYTAYENITLSTVEPTRDGYTFLGWTDGSKIYPAGASFCTWSDVVLVAVWEKSTSGFCGEYVSWQFDETTGTLTLSGFGAMYAYLDASALPWFDFRDGIQKVVIGENITSISDYAFYSYANITELILPESLTQIGICAFEKCTGLTKIDLPEGLTQIDTCAFEECTGLTEIVLPEGLCIIGGRAFAYCSGVKELSILAEAAQIDSYAFAAMTGLETVTIPNGMRNIGYGWFYRCSSLIAVCIPSSVIAMEEQAFMGCSSLSQVCYMGTAEQWTELIETNNSYLSAVPVSYGHDYERLIYTATCTQSGYAYYQCICGNAYDETVPAEGHSFDAAGVCHCGFVGIAAVTADGTTYHGSLEEAAEAGSYVVLRADLTADVTVTGDLWLDLNGKTISGDLTMEDGILYLFDSATADYTAANRGKIAGEISGNIARSFNTPALYGHNYKYLVLQEQDGSWSAHRYYLAVKSAVITPANATGTAVDYKTVFKCNEVVAQYVTAYGAKITGENTAYADAVAAGMTLAAGTNTAITTLENTLSLDYTEEVNSANILLAPTVNAYIVIDGQELTSTAVTKSLADLLVEVNARTDLSRQEKAALGWMYTKFSYAIDALEVDLAAIKSYAW